MDVEIFYKAEAFLEASPPELSLEMGTKSLKNAGNIDIDMKNPHFFTHLVVKSQELSSPISDLPQNELE